MFDMRKFLYYSLTAGIFALTSCIGSEPLNTECDIESAYIHTDNPSNLFYHDYDTLKIVQSVADSIGFLIRSHESVGLLPLHLNITPSAKVYILGQDNSFSEFRNGSDVDFSDEKVQRFRVVSEDGAWSRDYKINVVHDVPTAGDLKFDFADYSLDASGKYYEWSILDPSMAGVFTDGKWKNGNPGFKLSKSSAKPMDYPSVPLENGGPDGSSCVKLETRDTGSFGAMMNMRIASGSMFNGIFDVGNALKNALKATRFGSPFAHKPVKMTVWLKFEAGAQFQDKLGKPVEGVVDEPDAYVVFYRNQDEAGNEVMLDGNDILSSPYIVGVGRLPHHLNGDGSDQLSASSIHGLTTEWQLVELPVVYTKEVDPQILADKGYNIVIGFASSWQGAYFQGAIGSKLYIDNVSLYCDKDEIVEE